MAAATLTGCSSVTQQMVDPEPLRNPPSAPASSPGGNHLVQERDQRLAEGLVQAVAEERRAAPRSSAQRTRR